MSEFFKWDQSLQVGVNEMDLQHQKLINLMNDLQEKVAKKATKPELSSAIKALADWTVKHFQDEEAYMQKTGHQKLEVHKVIHQQLLKQFSEHVAKFETSGVLGEDFFKFLKVWLSAHIRGIDTQYGKQSAVKVA